MVRVERGTKKGVPPERVAELIQEAREVVADSGCSVTITVPGENGTALIPIGKTPELNALTPGQQHVIFAPEGAQVFSTKAPKQRRGKTHDLTGFTGFWRGTFYKDGIPQNGKNERGNHKK